MVGFFGHNITDEDVLNLAKEKVDFKPPTSLMAKIKTFFSFGSKLLFSRYNLRKTRTKYFQEFDLIRDKDFRNSHQLFEHICNSYDRYYISKEIHGECSLSSSLFNTVMMTILSKNNGI